MGVGKSIVKGNYDTSDPADNGCGVTAVRCVYAVNSGTGSKVSAVIGFTLMDGRTKGGYYTIGNGGLVIVNTTFAGNGNPYNASSIFGQVNGSAQVVLNCVVDGDQQNACTGACADGNWQSYRSGQAGWNHVTVMNLADLQNRDLRPRADSPVVVGGSFGNDAVITSLDQCSNVTAAQWYTMVTSPALLQTPSVRGSKKTGGYYLVEKR